VSGLGTAQFVAYRHTFLMAAEQIFTIKTVTNPTNTIFSHFATVPPRYGGGGVDIATPIIAQDSQGGVYGNKQKSEKSKQKSTATESQALGSNISRC